MIRRLREQTVEAEAAKQTLETSCSICDAPIESVSVLKGDFGARQLKDAEPNAM
jgi:hypothetical protein